MAANRPGKGAGARKAGRRNAAGPNLPQHNLPEPYARLMKLGYGDFESLYDEVAKELRAASAEAAARRLLDMALDERYYEYDDEDYEGGPGGDDRAWTRLHALRVLSRMGEAAHIGIEPLLPLLDAEDDYLREDAPFYYAAMGAAAVPALERTLADPDTPSYRRSGAGESLAEIGERHPELRGAIVPILERTLAVEAEDSALTGFLIISLCDLAATESMPTIVQAFEQDRVDETLVSLAEVQEHLGFPVTAERPRWRFGPGEPERIEPGTDLYDEDEDLPENMPYVAPEKVGRNDACPCGSGKKYKKCCGAPA
jgi:HEAT repeat protein